MGNWKERLDVSDLWKAKQGEEISLAQLCEGIVERAERLTIRPPAHLLDPFRELAEDDDEDIDAFDHAWNDIYNWADRDRVWVKTF